MMMTIRQTMLEDASIANWLLSENVPISYCNSLNLLLARIVLVEFSLEVFKTCIEVGV